MTEVIAEIITALQVQQRNKERVNVYVNGEYAFAVSLMMATTLRKGQELTPALIAELKQDGQIDLAYQRAVRYLSSRPRSAAEINNYLLRKEYAAEIIETVVNKLQSRGYLDDEAFARFWVDNRNRFRPRGAQALRYELRQKGVERETIDQALEDQDEDAAAWHAVEGKLDRWASLEKMEFNNKLMSHLARRGFGYAVGRRMANIAWEKLHEEE